VNPLPATLFLLLALALSPATAEDETGPTPGRWVEGFTEAWRDATLSTSSGGIVAAIHAREGVRVQTGQTIVEFRSEIEELEVGRRRVRMENAKRDYERTRDLFDRTSSVSREVLDRHEAEYHIARSEHDLAVEILNRTRVTAPFEGEVGDLFALEVGESRREREPIARLVDATRCRLVVHLDTAGRAITPAAKARVRLPDGTEVTGEIEFVSPVADPASGLFTVKVIFDNPGGLRPGVAAALWVPDPAAEKE